MNFKKKRMKNYPITLREKSLIFLKDLTPWQKEVKALSVQALKRL